VTITVLKDQKMASTFQRAGQRTVDHCKGTSRNIIWDEGLGVSTLAARVHLSSESLFNQFMAKQGKTVSFRGKSVKMYFTGAVMTNGSVYIVPVEFLEV
jgi:hypothetical protein